MNREARIRGLGGIAGAWLAGGLVLVLLGCDRPSPRSSSQAPAPAVPAPVTNMIHVPAGTFVRGRQVVTLSRDFWLGKYEVTQGEYQALRGVNPSKFVGATNRPVEKVSHVDAEAYCVALTQQERGAGRLPAGWAYRLPTEAEWEYACRAGTTNRFSFGDDPAPAAQYAWTDENSEGATHPVGQKLPNPWGFHDMHGNVWEWVQDWFGDYPAAPVTDPFGPSTSKFKVFRGGGWNNEVQFARSANRFGMAASKGIHFVGFRVALARTGP